MRASVRLPLQVGSTSSWSLLRAGLTLVPGAVLLVMGLRLFRGSEAAASALTVLLGAFLVLYALQQVVRAWQARPGDAVVDEQGVRFEGGHMHGVALDWAAIDPEQTYAEDAKELRLSLTRVLENALFLFFSTLLANSPELAPEQRLPVRRLHLKARDGRTWLAAVAEKVSEQQSLEALLGSIRSKLGAEPKAARVVPPGVLSCAACGAALSPSSEAVATCPFCGHRTGVPPELQERQRAQAALGAARVVTEQLVEALLEQPGTAKASASLALTAAGLAIAWAAAVVPLFLFGVDDVGTFEVGVALVAGALGSVAVVSLGKVGLINRGALRLLTASFGARAPVDPRGPPECRRCRAPLPSEARTVVGCVYCGAENILGVDLRAYVASAKEHQLSLEQVFASRQRRRARVLSTAAVSLVMGAVAGLALVVSASVSSDFAAEKRACSGGDGRACTDVARSFSTGSVIAKDEVKAAEFGERACALNDAEGCFDLSRAFAWGSGVPRDEERANALRAKACELGFAEACPPAK